MNGFQIGRRKSKFRLSRRVIQSRSDLSGVSRISRNRVVTMAAEWLASRQPPRGQPRALECAIAFDGLIGVARARRLETARSRERRTNRRLVPPDQRKQPAPRYLAESPPESAEGLLSAEGIEPPDHRSHD